MRSLGQQRRLGAVRARTRSVGTRYKFRILGRDGVWRENADPLAQHTEVPPATASVVYESAYEWEDADWMRERARQAARTRSR